MTMLEHKGKCRQNRLAERRFWAVGRPPGAKPPSFSAAGGAWPNTG
jgi:hypothetical protein